ncbi:MAG: PCC domain-containing protein, partial [Candidatus Hodarchaeota archaeon]
MSEDVNYQIQSAQLGRIFLVRLLPGADLIKTILKICEDHGIEYAYFDLVHGSFDKAVFSVFIPKKGVERSKEGPEKYDWYDFALTDVDKPTNLLAGGGWLCDAREPGKKEVVIHYVAGGGLWNQAAMGGHASGAKPNIVLTSMELIIFEVTQAKIVREKDEYGFVQT